MKAGPGTGCQKEVGVRMRKMRPSPGIGGENEVRVRMRKPETSRPDDEERPRC